MKKITLILLILALSIPIFAGTVYTNSFPQKLTDLANGEFPTYDSSVRRWINTNSLTPGTLGDYVYYVGTDTSFLYNTIQSAIDAIETHAATLTYTDTKYRLVVMPGVYTENLTITNLKYLRIEMAGVKIDGTVTLTTTQQTGDYYSKLEFWGGMSNRPEKGDNAEITGNIVGTRNNDSLIYLSFTGMELSGNLGFTTNGTWVVFMNHCYMSNSSGYLYGSFTGAGTPSVLLETMGLTRLKAHIANTDNSTTEVSLYDVIDTEFDLIDITPSFGGTVRNCEFKSDVTISAGTYEFDNFSYGEAVRQTEDFSGATITFMDSYNGGDVDVVGTLEALKYNFTDATELTIATGSITITQSAHTVDGESDAADNLDTIVGGANGDYLILSPANAARNITIRSGEDNILTPTGVNFTIPDNGTAILFYDGSNWLLTNSGGGFPLANDTYATSLDNAGTGTINLFKGNTSDAVEVGAPLWVNANVYNTDSGLVPAGMMAVAGSAVNGFYWRLADKLALQISGTGQGDGTVESVDVAINGQTTQETYCIRKVVSQNDLVDNTATNIFTITTATGEFGGYKCGMTILAGDSLATGNANLAAMGLDAHFVRVLTSSDAATTSAVAEISQTASANQGTGAVTDITITVDDTTPLVPIVKAAVDVTSVVGVDVIIVIELVYWGFATAPVIAGS